MTILWIEFYYDLIKTDECSRLIWKHIYDTCKPNKRKYAKLKARSSMRRLSRLVTLCKAAERCEDLFKVRDVLFSQLWHQHWPCQSWFESCFGNIADVFCEVLVKHFTILGQKDKTEEVIAFKRVLKTNYPKIFSGAEYQLKEKRQRENRKDAALPSEADLDKLRCHMADEIAKINQIESKKDYIHARRVVLARLTLINGRRGSEPAHLLIRGFQERHTWLGKTKLNDKQKAVLERYSITYVMGKGASLVSVFFPEL